MGFSELLADYGLPPSSGDYGVTPAIIVVALTFLWQIMKLSYSGLDNEKYPSYLPSLIHKGKEAGMIETITGVTGSRAPRYIYESLQALPPGKTWISRLRMPVPKDITAAFVVADAEITRAFLTHPDTFKPDGYDEFDFLTGGPSMISTNGMRWKHARKGSAPAFSSNHIKRMNRICLEQLEKWMEEVLDPLTESGEAFDIGEELIYITLQVIAEAGFEYKISKEEMDAFINAFEVSSREFIIMNPLHRKFQFLFPQVWRAKRASKILQALAFKIMNAYRESEKGKKGKSNEYTDDTIISRIVNNENYADDADRAADIILFLAGGHDTTAYSIAWTLIEVAKNGNDSQLEKYRHVAVNIDDVEALRRVDELQYIIKEGMRLHAVAAMGPARQNRKAFDFKGDDGNIHIPPNSFMWFNHFSMFRHKKYFGDDADLFRPGRWKDSNDAMSRAFVPFTLGRQNCIGQSLANAEASTVISVLLAKYDFSVAEAGEEDYFLTLKPKGTKLVARKLK